jgi:Uma2 family endonuclease
MATTQPVGERRFVIEEVSWAVYEELLKCWASRSKRMTFDGDRLEFMSPQLLHENTSAILCVLVWTLALERRIDLRTGGSTTLTNKGALCGLEPDGSFWIQHEQVMRHRDDFDPDKDPQPDLAIEVEYVPSALDRMSIYARLGVPEVWRFDGKTLTINQLQRGVYRRRARSLALPLLTTAVLTRFLGMRGKTNDTSLTAAFVDWVRKQPGRRRKK